VKRAIDLLAAVIAAVCNASLQSGYFPQSQKQARVTARLKKPSVDPDDLNSFRPISSLTFLSKCGYQTVYQPCCPERSLPGKANRVSPISLYWVGSASAPQWHRFCYWPRRSHWSSTFGLELCIWYCRLRLTTVDPWVSIFGHRTVTGMVPLILDGPCTGVYQHWNLNVHRDPVTRDRYWAGDPVTRWPTRSRAVMCNTN